MCVCVCVCLSQRLFYFFPFNFSFALLLFSATIQETDPVFFFFSHAGKRVVFELQSLVYFDLAAASAQGLRIVDD